MLEFKTIESDRYEKAEDGIHVKHVGMIKAQEAFDQLKAHLEKVGLLPDEYFLSGDFKPDMELPEFATAICHTNWGGSEGIYIDVLLKYHEDKQLKFFDFATGKTLGDSGDDFIKMSRIAAECSMMLNGRGSIVRVSESSYDNIQLTTEEKSLISKALDAMGDRVADTQGYSSGEKYWDLKEKFEPVLKDESLSNELLKGKSSSFVEVYKLVKAARIPNYNGKALNDIRDKYGYNLYKEALDVVLKEKIKEENVKLYSQMQKAFNELPLDEINKTKMTPFVFYDFVSNHISQFSSFQELKSTLDSLMISYLDDDFIEMFNNIQSQHKPSLSSQIKSAESKSTVSSSNTNEITKTTENIL